MQAFIGAKLLESREAQPRVKPFEISDCQLLGFTLRVQPSGARSYYVRFFRNRRVTLGKVDSLSPEEARDRCQRVLGNLAHGRHPLHGLDGMGPTLGQFIALAGKADIIVTGDRAMLDLRTYERMPILSLRQFLDDFEETAS